mmetsp:Transcript_87869/g.174438  ORF Transcript_87869/g.174438 Transcript_87869/m.174438 type:complete len:119 (-) Transcript_87869:419-775(-)
MRRKRKATCLIFSFHNSTDSCTLVARLDRRPPPVAEIAPSAPTALLRLLRGNALPPPGGDTSRAKAGTAAACGAEGKVEDEEAHEAAGGPVPAPSTDAPAPGAQSLVATGRGSELAEK